MAKSTAPVTASWVAMWRSRSFQTDSPTILNALTADGQVKVLDFGLAKVVGPAEAGHYVSEVSNSPPMTLGATQAGVILRTAAYMAPEQAKGRRLTSRHQHPRSLVVSQHFDEELKRLVPTK